MPTIPAPQMLVGVPQITFSSIALNITESDVTTYENVRAVWFGGTGTAVVTMNGEDVTFANIPDGTMMPISITKLKAASTVSSVVLLF